MILWPSVEYVRKGRVGGVWEDRRYSPLVQHGPSGAVGVYYRSDAHVRHGATSVVVPAHTSAVVWPANGKTFDVQGQRWVNFTTPAGGHYVCPQDALAGIGASQDVLPIEYSTRHGWRRWQPRISGPGSTPPPPNPYLVTSAISGHWTITADTNITGNNGTTLNIFLAPSFSPVPTWTALAYSDPSWTASGATAVLPWGSAVVSQLQSSEGFLPAPGSDLIWNTNPPYGLGVPHYSGVAPGSAFRQIFTLPAGTILSATLSYIGNSTASFWINGHSPAVYGAGLWLPTPAPATPPAGTNDWYAGQTPPPAAVAGVDPTQLNAGGSNILAAYVHTGIDSYSFPASSAAYSHVDGALCWVLSVLYL